MAKPKAAPAAADTSNESNDTASTETGTTAAAEGGSQAEGGAQEGADQTATDQATATVDTAGETATAESAEVPPGLAMYDKPKTAAEALDLVKQFYSQAEFLQAVAELNSASTAAASSIAPALLDDKAAYRVLSPLEHNQKRLVPGKTVLLTAEEAAPLLGHTVEAI